MKLINMKWNWGYTLTVVFIAFAAHISYMVYKCTQEKFDLVSADYYNQELRYQDKIDGAKNAQKLNAVTLTQTSGSVCLQLPQQLDSKTVTGEVWLYCPANAALDFKHTLQVNKDGCMLIDKKNLAPVTYTAKISWQSGDTKYYNEQKLAVNK